MQPQWPSLVLGTTRDSTLIFNRGQSPHLHQWPCEGALLGLVGRGVSFFEQELREISDLKIKRRQENEFIWQIQSFTSGGSRWLKIIKGARSDEQLAVGQPEPPCYKLGFGWASCLGPAPTSLPTPPSSPACIPPPSPSPLNLRQPPVSQVGLHRVPCGRGGTLRLHIAQAF